MSDNETTERILRASKYYSQLGWKILPCHGIVGGRCTCGRPHGEPKEVGKHPAINEWNVHSTSDELTIDGWWETNENYNIGVHCQKSGLFVIDIDPRSGGPESFHKFEEMVEGALPPTIEAITGLYTTSGGKAERGRHIFYRCDQSESLVGNLNKMGLKGVDIKHNGYVLIAPSRHFSGVTYEWAEGKAPWEIEVAEAPEELLTAIRRRSRRTYSLGSGDWSWIDDSPKVDLEKLFAEGIDEGSRAVDIYQASCALANKYGTDDQARQVIETMMLRFNAEKVRPPLDIEGPNGLLQHVHRAIDFVAANPKVGLQSPQAAEWLMARGRAITENSKAGQKKKQEESPLLGVVRPPSVPDDDDVSSSAGMTVSANVRSALESSGSIHTASSLTNMDVPKDPDALLPEDGGEEGRRSLSDTGNGRRLIDSFGGGLRYTTGLGWFVWDRGYWRPDSEDLGVYELAKKIPPVISREIENYGESQQSDVIKWAHASRSNARLKSMVESAKSDPRISVEVSTWDKDKHLLGVANGIIDLFTGELYKGNPDIYITRRSPVSYTSGLTNVKWAQFLNFATDGDKEFQDWLQRAAGYSITGLSKYDILFLVYGPPGSGKNTFVEALVKAIGTQQYAWPLDSSILASGDTNTSSTDLYHWAELRGRRMVWVDELPESERIKENAIKKLTGSSEISARSPGEKPFTFQSQAKLWISTNHRPVITDDAMWRRIRPIPFLRIPTEPDPNLKEYIFDPEGALPAVLSWAVEGAIKILNAGAGDALGWCTKVTEAADIYRKNEDRIGIFLEEETVEMEGAAIPLKNLYPIYRSWSDQRGERPMTQTTFQRKLVERNIELQGHGHRALVVGRNLAPRDVAPMGGGIDFSEALRRQVSY